VTTPTPVTKTEGRWLANIKGKSARCSAKRKPGGDDHPQPSAFFSNLLGRSVSIGMEIGRSMKTA
jgi:hypothetical protein